jgi:hypothetical protein
MQSSLVAQGLLKDDVCGKILLPEILVSAEAGRPLKTKQYRQ